ncbi:HEPN domain-containing protein [Mucilaginibacter sp.]|uniref:ApeA N-terminal domain 1-containing protein n=1 Tax=Mucilaginibacter sp. TaxID=1882438 RepID=UPI0035BB9F54
MIDAVEIKGYWFLPDDPENRIAGILTYLPNRKITLELIGSFKDPHDYMFALAQDDSKRTDIILGESSDAESITLLNCSSYGTLNFSCSFPMQKFNVQYCLQGIHLKSLQDAAFNQVTVKMPGLTKWVNHYCVKYSIPFKNDKVNGFNLSFDRDNSNIISVQLGNDLDLELEFTCSPPATPHDEKLLVRQAYQLNILSKSNLPFRELLSQISKFKSFLTLGTLTNIGYQSIELYSPNEYQELMDGEKIHHPINFYYNQLDKVNADKINTKDFLFTYDSIEASFEDVIKNWYGFDDLMAPIIKHLIESIHERNIFNTGDFLIVVQALEGYATRFRPNIPASGRFVTLKEQLTFLRDQFSYVQLVKNTSLYLDIVVNSRHYYSHFFHKKANVHVATGIELYELTQKLKVILVCCVLSQVGFAQNDIITIMKAYRDRVN